MKKEEIRIPLADRTIHGYRYIPDENRLHSLVILSHGFNGFETDLENTACYLASQGLEAVAWSFCGGSNREKLSGFPTRNMTLDTETEELLALAEEARSWEQVDPDKIFLFGASQGGMVSALAAARKPELPAGLILLFPAFCIPDDWRSKFKPDTSQETIDFWGVELGQVFYDTVKDLQVFDTIGAYEGPVLIMHGREDQVVPVSYGIQAAKVYKNAVLEIFENEMHGFTPEGDRRMEGMLLYFIHRQLTI